MESRGGIIVEEKFVCSGETHLTVQKTSLFFSGDGFSVYDSRGELVFRVDSYGPDAGETTELILVDAAGRCILNVRRKRPSLHNRWEGFMGEQIDGQKPLFSVRRSSMMGRTSITVEVYTDPIEEYRIQGSFVCRNCNVFNSNNEIVAVIRRKVDYSTDVLLGNDVFMLSLKEGFDGAFAMGLVMVMDQIIGDDHDDDDINGSKAGVDPIVEDSESSL